MTTCWLDIVLGDVYAPVPDRVPPWGFIDQFADVFAVNCCDCPEYRLTLAGVTVTLLACSVSHPQ
jgi:hypothetical protein